MIKNTSDNISSSSSSSLSLSPTRVPSVTAVPSSNNVPPSPLTSPLTEIKIPSYVNLARCVSGYNTSLTSYSSPARRDFSPAGRTDYSPVAINSTLGKEFSPVLNLINEKELSEERRFGKRELFMNCENKENPSRTMSNSTNGDHHGQDQKQQYLRLSMLDNFKNNSFNNKVTNRASRSHSQPRSFHNLSKYTPTLNKNSNVKYLSRTFTDDTDFTRTTDDINYSDIKRRVELLEKASCNNLKINNINKNKLFTSPTNEQKIEIIKINKEQELNGNGSPIPVMKLLNPEFRAMLGKTTKSPNKFEFNTSTNGCNDRKVIKNNIGNNTSDKNINLKTILTSPAPNSNIPNKNYDKNLIKSQKSNMNDTPRNNINIVKTATPTVLKKVLNASNGISNINIRSNPATALTELDESTHSLYNNSVEILESSQNKDDSIQIINTFNNKTKSNKPIIDLTDSNTRLNKLVSSNEVNKNNNIFDERNYTFDSGNDSIEVIAINNITSTTSKKNNINIEKNISNNKGIPIIDLVNVTIDESVQILDNTSNGNVKTDDSIICENTLNCSNNNESSVVEVRNDNLCEQSDNIETAQTNTNKNNINAKKGLCNVFIQNEKDAICHDVIDNISKVIAPISNEESSNILKESKDDSKDKNGMIEISKDIKKNEKSNDTELNFDATDSNIVKDGNYYKKILETEREILIKLINRYEPFLNQFDEQKQLNGSSEVDGAMNDDSKEGNEISSEVEGQLLSTLGQSKLLINKKFAFFELNCNKNLKHNANLPKNEDDIDGDELKVLNEDLTGLWDTIYIQINNVKDQFEYLNKLKNNNWKLIENDSKRLSLNSNIVGDKKKINNIKRVSKSTSQLPKLKIGETSYAQNERKKFLEEKRKAILAEKRKLMNKNNENDGDGDENQAGFVQFL